MPPITSQPVRSTTSAECFRVDLTDGTAAALGRWVFYGGRGEPPPIVSHRSVVSLWPRHGARSRAADGKRRPEHPTVLGILMSMSPRPGDMWLERLRG